jgi:P pilus assembly chaperone PapD
MHKNVLRILLLALLLILLAFVVPSSTPVAIGESRVLVPDMGVAKAVTQHE